MVKTAFANADFARYWFASQSNRPFFAAVDVESPPRSQCLRDLGSARARRRWV